MWAADAGDGDSMLRGLWSVSFGDGVCGGLPGKEGAQTICSGETVHWFTLYSLRLSTDKRPGDRAHPETDEEMESARSRLSKRSVDGRRTERSNGLK